MSAKPREQKSLSLALQGGGAHGAFVWGVLDQLLIDGRTDIEAISAVGGGTLSAVVMAQGMLENGNEGAREHLLAFWKKISTASTLLPIRFKTVDKILGHAGIDISPSTLALDYITRLFSPSQFNLFDINPLRGIVDELVDFHALQKHSPITLYANATQVRTGKGVAFTGRDLTLDAVMASSCLPYMFKAVEIDGQDYWDGSFSGCPALAPLANNSTSPDILLVQVHPSQVEETPSAAADILDRATELSFNAVLRQELKTIALYNRFITNGALKQKPVHFHRIESQEMLASLGRSSKLNTDWDFLLYLHDLGVQAATDWLDSHFASVGTASSTDIETFCS